MSKSGVQALTADQIDHLGLALITLAKELWVMKDRQMLMEAFLMQKGLLPDLEMQQPSAELAQRIALERERFLSSMAAVLFDGHNATTDTR